MNSFKTKEENKVNNRKKKCVAILLVSMALFSFSGCGKVEKNVNTNNSTKQSDNASNTKFSKEEVKSAATELIKQYHEKGGHDAKNFDSLFINTKEDIINKLYQANIESIDMYDGLNVDVHYIDGNKALVSKLLYIVTGSGKNTRYKTAYETFCLTYIDGKWKFDNSDATLAWGKDLLYKTWYSKEATVIPENKKWHNTNPLTVNDFVVPGTYIVEPAELYYKEDGSMEFTILVSNGMYKNIHINSFNNCTLKDANEKVIFDISQSGIDKPLKSGNAMLISFTIPADKVNKNSDLSRVKWDISTMYD